MKNLAFKQSISQPSPCGILPFPGSEGFLASIPDTSGPVMRQTFQLIPLLLLHGIIQEKVDQDGIDRRMEMHANDLPSDQLDAPDAAPPQLDLPRISAGDLPPVPDVSFQPGTVPQTTHPVQHLRQAVVWKSDVQ
jgi:hypothetical protein